MSEKDFKKGDTVEVIRDDNDDQRPFNSPSYFAGTVIRSPAKTKHHVYIEYQGLSKSGQQNGSLKPVREYIELSKVRPVPPPEPDRSFNLCESVDAFYDGAWRKGTVSGILPFSKYLVLFDGEDHPIEIGWSNLRLHREWTEGFWVPPFPEQKDPSEFQLKSREVKFRIKFNRRNSEAKFSKGTVVEVRSDEEGCQGSWYTAVIVGPVGNGKFLVEYQMLKTINMTELLKEETDASCIRPCPPEIEGVDHFEESEQVDAWYNNGWWTGHISKVLDNLNYVVSFGAFNVEMVFEHSKLRSHQEWVDGKWVAASKRNSPELEMKSKEVKFKIKCTGGKSEPKFCKGMMVEVKSDEEGYQGSWYTAVIVGSIGVGKFLVEYQTLKTDDESEPLKEKASSLYIRPCPPKIQRHDCFMLLEEVDAWYNDGWWVGLVCRLLDGSKYAVYFWTTNEEIVFEHSNLRPHQEWIGGNWLVASGKKSKLPVKSRPGQLKSHNCRTLEAWFSSGTKVEVKTDEEGYLGSWYPAVVLQPTGSSKYLVEYQTLKTDDEIELLKEEADAMCIRPCPPVLQQTEQYKPFEEVDAWCNYGWWVGNICKVLEGSKYSVYFKNTNELLEFEHCNLRPHQDWVDGKWIISSRGWN